MQPHTMTSIEVTIVPRLSSILVIHGALVLSPVSPWSGHIYPILLDAKVYPGPHFFHPERFLDGDSPYNHLLRPLNLVVMVEDECRHQIVDT